MKKCSRCLRALPITEFGRRAKNRDGHKGACKQCDREVTRAWQSRHPEQTKQAGRQSRAKTRDITWEIKQSTACADCGGYFQPWQMDFDHTENNKTAEVSMLVRSSNREAVLAEMAKCEVVCANCHRTRTHMRRNAKTED